MWTRVHILFYFDLSQIFHIFVANLYNMRWDDLNMGDKSRMIKLAVDSGITDLRTIRDVYNSYADGGQKERKPISNKLLKDLAYKIGSNRVIQAQGAASILDIAKALLGKNPPMDDNKYAYIYGTGERYPEIEEEPKGFDYSNYLDRYGYKGVKNVYGTINPTKEYHIDESLKPLAEELARNNYHFYDDADDMFLDYDPDVLGYRDDVANFIHQFALDKNGNVVVHDSDVYDFNPVDYDYSRGVSKPLVKLEASLMDRIGTPYIIRQENQPLKFDGSRRGSGGIEDHLRSMSDEDIAKATGATLLDTVFVTAEHSDPDYDPYDFSGGGLLKTPNNIQHKFWPGGGIFKKKERTVQLPESVVTPQYVSYWDATPEQTRTLTNRNGKYNTASMGDKGYTHFDTISARYKGLNAAMQRANFSEEEMSRLSPFLLTQLALEGGWVVDRPDNNFGGMMSGGKRIEFDTEDSFYDTYLKNLDARWGDEYLGKGKGWRNAKTINEYADIINREDLGLHTKETFDAYNRKHRDHPAYIYTPLWENNNTGLMDENKFGGIYNRALGNYELLMKRMEEWDKFARNNKIIAK